MTKQNEEKLREYSKELDSIQTDIWARINDELVKDNVQLSIGTAYGAGQSIKEILHPRARKLIQKALEEQKAEIIKELRESLEYYVPTLEAKRLIEKIKGI